MLAKVTSCAVVGLDGAIVEVEFDISPGLPSVTTVDTTFGKWQGQWHRRKRTISNNTMVTKKS